MLLCRWYDVRQERVDLERNVDEVPFTGSALPKHMVGTRFSLNLPPSILLVSEDRGELQYFGFAPWAKP